MDEKKDAFQRASEALLQLGLPKLLPVLAAAGVALKREILGGSHSVVTYPPINSLAPADSRIISSVIRFSNTVHLYIHIAFCETKCSFCHYAVEQYSGQENKRSHVRRYLEAVKKEMALWSDQLRQCGTTVSSVYIGGGTPLVLETSELEEIVAILSDRFTLIPGAEVCVEGSPLTITAPGGAQKLRLLRAAGVTRLSFGVQSFDDTVLHYGARGYKRETALEACRIVGSIFSNWNLDLIQGLYRGSTNEVWENLQVLKKIRPPHLTWYHGRFADRPQGEWLQISAKRDAFEDDQATLLGRMMLWQELTQMGYNQTDGNRFVRDTRFADPFKKTRTSVANDLLGMGASAYSHLSSDSPNGWFFRNTPDIVKYIDVVESGITPIASARSLNAVEIWAASYVIGLRTVRTENADVQRVRASLPKELLDYYDKLVDRLIDNGIIERVAPSGADGLRLTTLGRLFEDEVLALFYSPSVQKSLI